MSSLWDELSYLLNKVRWSEPEVAAMAVQTLQASVPFDILRRTVLCGVPSPDEKLKCEEIKGHKGYHAVGATLWGRKEPIPGLQYKGEFHVLAELQRQATEDATLDRARKYEQEAQEYRKGTLAGEPVWTTPTFPPTFPAEQQARDMLERLGYPHAQNLTASDVVEPANLIAELRRLQALIKARTDACEVLLADREKQTKRAEQAEAERDRLRQHAAQCVKCGNWTCGYCGMHDQNGDWWCERCHFGSRASGAAGEGK